jgi:hypothetical protein
VISPLTYSIGGGGVVDPVGPSSNPPSDTCECTKYVTVFLAKDDPLQIAENNAANTATPPRPPTRLTRRICVKIKCKPGTINPGPGCWVLVMEQEQSWVPCVPAPGTPACVANHGGPGVHELMVVIIVSRWKSCDLGWTPTLLYPNGEPMEPTTIAIAALASTQTSASILDTPFFRTSFGDIQIYKKLTTEGTLKTYNLGDKVLYKDRVFVLTSTFMDLIHSDTNVYYANIFENGIPSQTSKYWTELSIPPRLSFSKTEPVGIKLIGDRWFNPITELMYVYTKINNTQYIWLSD